MTSLVRPSNGVKKNTPPFTIPQAAAPRRPHVLPRRRRGPPTQRSERPDPRGTEPWMYCFGISPLMDVVLFYLLDPFKFFFFSNLIYSRKGFIIPNVGKLLD